MFYTKYKKNYINVRNICLKYSNEVFKMNCNAEKKTNSLKACNLHSSQ